jgi:molecular chaperone GrpE
VRLELVEHAEQRERRQRVQHQQEMAAMLVDLLGVLDTIDAAARHRVAETDRLRAQLHHVLSGHGIERVDGDRQPFDPTVHEAVHHEPGTGPPMVVDLLRPGYLWNGRVLRPALVSVRG